LQDGNLNLDILEQMARNNPPPSKDLDIVGFEMHPYDLHCIRKQLLSYPNYRYYTYGPRFQQDVYLGLRLFVNDQRPRGKPRIIYAKREDIIDFK